MAGAALRRAGRLGVCQERLAFEEAKLARERDGVKFKFELHLQAAPSCSQTDYSDLGYALVSDIKTPIIYPFTANIDEAFWF